MTHSAARSLRSREQRRTGTGIVAQTVERGVRAVASLVGAETTTLPTAPRCLQGPERGREGGGGGEGGRSPRRGSSLWPTESVALGNYEDSPQPLRVLPTTHLVRSTLWPTMASSPIAAITDTGPRPPGRSFRTFGEILNTAFHVGWNNGGSYSSVKLHQKNKKGS